MQRSVGILGAVLFCVSGPVDAQESPDELQAALEAADRVEGVRFDPERLVVQLGDTLSVQGVAVDSLGQDVPEALWGATDGATFQIQPVQDSAVAQAFLLWGQEPGTGEMGLFVATADSEGQPRWNRIGGVEVTVLDYPVSEIQIDPMAYRPYVGTEFGLSAQVLTTQGTVHQGQTARWTSSDTSVVHVDPEGQARFLRTGAVDLVARADSVDAVLTVTVVENPVANLTLPVPPSRVRTGDVLQLAAHATDSDGAAVSEAATSYRVSRLDDAGTEKPTEEPGEDSVSEGPSAGADPAAEDALETSRPGAHVDEDGAFVAEGAGRYRVMATSGDASVSTDVVVFPRDVGQDASFVAHVPTVRATDLWVFEGLDGRDYAYTGTLNAATMYAIDVTDPANPTKTDSVTVDGRRVNDVKINDDRTLAIITSENASNRQNGITLLGIEDPSHPVILSHYTTNLTGGVHNVWFVGDLVYAVNDGTLDVHIIDVSDPAEPVEVGRWGLDRRNKYLHDVSVVDGLAYLSYWNDGVVILDVGAGIAGGTPVQPELVSSYKYAYDVNGETYGNTHHAIRYGDYLFLGDEIFGCPGCQGPRGYVHVLDVSDIRNPVEVARYEVPEAGSHNLWVEDDRMYIGYYQGGLRVVDVSGELRGDLLAQGREIAHFDTSEGTGTMSWGPQPYKGHVFVSDMNSGLWIVRIEPRDVLP